MTDLEAGITGLIFIVACVIAVAAAYYALKDFP